MIAELRSRVETLERQLDVRQKEIRRRDAALDREQQLTTMFAERLRALEGQSDRPEEAGQDDATSVIAPQEGDPPVPTTPSGGAQPPTLPSELIAYTPVTTLLFATGVGLAAGVANPLVVAQINNLLLVPMLLLWTLPAVFGLWLGRNVIALVHYLTALIEYSTRQMEELPVPTDDRPSEGRDPWERPGSRQELEHTISFFRRRRYYEGSYPAIGASLVALATVAGSASAFWFAEGFLPGRTASAVTIAQGIVAALFTLFAALIGMGRARQRLEAAKPALVGARVTREASSANRQALIGLMGTIVTAVLALVGVLVQVYGGNGGGPGP
jgi:hypothetical protein